MHIDPKSETTATPAPGCISPDVEKREAARCGHCAKPLFIGDTIGRTSFGIFCDACTNEANACKHEDGYVTQHYDEDGCGFRVWHCRHCAFQTFED